MTEVRVRQAHVTSCGDSGYPPNGRLGTLLRNKDFYSDRDHVYPPIYGNTFSKVLYIVLYSQDIGALIFQNFCQRQARAQNDRTKETWCVCVCVVCVCVCV